MFLWKVPRGKSKPKFVFGYDRKPGVQKRRKPVIFSNVNKHFQCKLEGKYSLESTDPRESEIRAHLRP